MNQNRQPKENKITKRIIKSITDQFALLTFEFAIVLFFGLVSFLVFIGISDLLLQGEILPIDEKVYYWVRYYVSDSLTRVMLAATFLGNRQFTIVLAVAVLVYFLFLKPHRWHSIRIAAVALGSISANLLLKAMFQRERPLVEHMIQVTGMSFPSGHAMFAMSFYGLLVFIIWKEADGKAVRYGISGLLSVLIFLIGISRIYLGVHYASDVLAGFAAGFIWLVLSLGILGKIEKSIKIKNRASVS